MIISDDIEKLKSISYRDINQLTISVKKYIAESRRLASEKLKGNKVLSYIEDPEKAKIAKEKYEKEFKTEI